jgi:hypothetical protein
MLAEITMNIHEHLYLKCKVDPIGLALERIIGLALHQLVLSCGAQLKVQIVEIILR